MKIVQNTYPEHPTIPHAKPGDEVEWYLSRSAYWLFRKSDKKSLFSTSAVNSEGLLYSSKKPPKLIGVIAQVKSKGWILEIE